MGERSQIYVRVTNSKGEKSLIARYFQWNYGERMISRARWTIEAAHHRRSDYYWANSGLEKITRIIDVNFDMHDISMSDDIIEWYRCDRKDDDDLDFNQYAFFMQDNNDGKLLIDVNIGTQSIKYAFLDGEASSDYVMDADAYMAWYCACSHDAEKLAETDWRKEIYAPEPEDFKDEEYEAIVQTCENNINAINSMATLMTKEEVDEFLACDYAI